MRVRSLSMRREGDYGSAYGKVDYSKPFQTTIEMEGNGNELKLQIGPEVSEKIMALIADEVVKAGKIAAEALTFSAFVIDALPAPEPKPKTLSEEIPF